MVFIDNKTLKLLILVNLQSTICGKNLQFLSCKTYLVDDDLINIYLYAKFDLLRIIINYDKIYALHAFFCLHWSFILQIAMFNSSA